MDSLMARKVKWEAELTPRLHLILPGLALMSSMTSFMEFHLASFLTKMAMSLVPMEQAISKSFQVYLALPMTGAMARLAGCSHRMV